MQKNRQFDTFKLKDGREVDIVTPSMDYLQAITDFVNKLSKEDTFLSFAGETYSIEMEKNWLENVLNEIKFKKNLIIWAVENGKIIGGCDIRRRGNRDHHVGSVGLMVDSDFRGQGLGEFLLREILQKGKEMDIKIAYLDVFSENLPAQNLYRKVGFTECGRLPNGLYRKGKYSDVVMMYLNLENYDK